MRANTTVYIMLGRIIESFLFSFSVVREDYNEQTMHRPSRQRQ